MVNSTRGRGRAVALVILLGLFVTALVVPGHSGEVAAAEATDPCAPDRPTILGADGRSVSPRPQTVVQVYPTGAICQLEQRIVASIAADRGTALTEEIRAEILAYGRAEVRSRLLVELISLTQPRDPLDEVEEAALDWFVDRYRDFRELAADESESEYASWAELGCDYVAPEGFEYFAPEAECGGLTSLFSGGPNPPSYQDFVAYGSTLAARSIAGADFDGVIEEFAQSTQSVGRVLFFSGALASSVVLGTLLGLVKPVAAVATFALTKAATSLIAAAFGASAAIVVLAVVLSISRGIDLLKASQIPGQLAADATRASAVDVGALSRAALSSAGMNELVLTFLDATGPDHPEVPAAVVPPAAPAADAPFWVSETSNSTLGLPASQIFRYLDESDGISHAWVKDGWFVVEPIDPPGDRTLEPMLSFTNQRGSVSTARIVGDEMVVVDTALPGDADCVAPRCELSKKINHLVDGPDGTEFAVTSLAGLPPEITSGPDVAGVIESGSVVTLSADAVDPEGTTLEYTWEVSGDGFDAVTTYDGRSVPHRLAGPGQYTVTVTVTDETGATASASVSVEVPLPSTELTARTQRFFNGAWRNLSFIQGQPGRLVVTSTEADVCISVDWDSDGVIDDSASTTSGTVTFDTPVGLVLPVGVAPIELVANFAGCDGAEIDRVTVSAEVVNAPPYGIVVELKHPDGEFRSSPTAESAPTYEEGTSIPVRLSARDDGGPGSLSFVLFSRLGGRVPIETKVVVADPPIDGVNSEVETFITAIDQRPVTSGGFDLLVAAEDEFGQSSTETPFSYFNIVNVAPNIEEIDTTSDNLGNVTLAARVSDPGVAQLDVERITIDWGDGSAVADVPVDSSIDNRYFFADVVGQGEHQYEMPGTYAVTVTAFDDVTSVSRQIELTLQPFQPIIADITELAVGVEGSPTTIAVEIDDPDTDPSTLLVEIDWGDGTTSPAVYDEASGTFVGTHVYAMTGTFPVTLTPSEPLLELVGETVEGSVTVPDAPVAVTVEQSATQLDPTTASTVSFDIVFSEPVIGFDSDDLALSGTAGADVASVVDSGDATTYTAVVSGMKRTGTVVVDVAEGAAVNGDDLPSLASTSVDNEVQYVPPIDLTLPGLDGVFTVVNDPGAAGAIVEFDVTASGGASAPVVTCTPVSGSFFPIGSTDVTCVGDDGARFGELRVADAAMPLATAAELTATASFVVTVVDAESPTVAPLGEVVAVSDDGGPVEVTFTAPAAADNSGSVTVSCAPASGSVFPVGSTTIACTATDGAGNTAPSVGTVTVTATQVGGDAGGPPATTPPPTAGQPGATPPPNLPTTGASTGWLVRLAATLLLFGAFLLLGQRRSRRSSGSLASS